MSLISGLMAGTNFLTGIHAEELAKQRQDYINSMQNLSLQNAQFNMNQRIQTQKDQQAESDAAMRIFNPSLNGGNAPNNTQGHTQNNSNLMSQQGNPSNNTQSVIEKVSKLANFDFARGNISGGTKLMAQANSMNELAYKGKSQNLAMQMGELKRQQETYKTIAQHLGSSTDPKSFEQNKLWVLSNVPMPAHERNNILSMQYSPALVKNINSSGMSASEQAGIKLREAQNKNTETHYQAMENSYLIRANVAKQRAAAYIAAQKRNMKVGHLARVPTKQDMLMADASAQDIFFGKPGGNDVSNPQYHLFKDSLVSKALALMANQPNLTFDGALQEVGQQMKQDGSLNVVYGEPNFFTGNREPKTTFTQPTSNIIDLTPNMTEKDMVIGKYYRGQQGVREWTKNGWGPIQ